jgi:RimJ/RimL family protein N-acetyltransferase
MSQTSLKETFTALAGDKVVLKPFVQSDGTPEYVAWLNDPVVVKYSNQRFAHHTQASCTTYLAGFENTGNLFIKIEQKADGLFVGTMTAYVSPVHQTADVGIMIGHRPAWGKGLGQDAWSTLLNWLLHQDSIRKVTAGTMRCNTAMVNLMERSGMILEAVRPKQELLDGVPQDLLYFGKFSDAIA